MDLSAEGKALGFDSEEMVCDSISEKRFSYNSLQGIKSSVVNQPLFLAPHSSQVRIVFLFPVDSSRRFPQSVQNTKDPMADIATEGAV